jgi:hypothetical protein
MSLTFSAGQSHLACSQSPKSNIASGAPRDDAYHYIDASNPDYGASFYDGGGFGLMTFCDTFLSHGCMQATGVLLISNRRRSCHLHLFPRLTQGFLSNSFLRDHKILLKSPVAEVEDSTYHAPCTHQVVFRVCLLRTHRATMVPTLRNHITAPYAQRPWKIHTAGRGTSPAYTVTPISSGSVCLVKPS